MALEANERSTEVESKLASLGGRMYGDGRYVVEFSGGGAQMAPLKASVTDLEGPGTYVEITYGLGAKQSIGLAGQAISAGKRALAGS